MKPILFLLALLAIIQLGGCRTQYVEHPSVNLSPPAPETAPVAPEPIVMPTPAPTPTPTPEPTPAARPSVTILPPAAPVAPEPTPSTTPAATPSTGPTPRPDREAYISKPYPRVRIKVQDEGTRDPSFKAFRDQLDQVIAARNLDALTKMINTDKIVTDPNGKPGMTTFVEHWKLTYNVRQSELWPKLAETLRLGAKAVPDKGQFTSPAIGFETEAAAGVLDKHIDPPDRAIVIGTDVNARTDPATSAQPLEKLSYEIVKIAAPVDPENIKTIGDETHPWYQIVLPDGKRAWVWGKYLRPWTDTRATFEKTGDQWKLIGFAKE